MTGVSGAKARNFIAKHPAMKPSSPSDGLEHRRIDSCHCSRYNMQTKRLAGAMFEPVFRDIAKFLRGTR
jgi:uracil-DNA glycosylase